MLGICGAHILPTGLTFGFPKGRLVAAVSVHVGSLSPKFKINYWRICITQVKQQNTILSISVMWKLHDGKKSMIQCEVLRKKDTPFQLTPVIASQVPRWLKTKLSTQTKTSVAGAQSGGGRGWASILTLECNKNLLLRGSEPPQVVYL